MDAAFENDHLTYKRAMPIKNGRIDADCVFYIGDGALAVDLRDIPEKASDLEYLTRAAAANHLIRLQLYENRQQFDTMEADGSRFDSYTRFR